MALERHAAHLAVGDDRDVRYLLQAQGLLYGIVLDSLELGDG